jgi:ABC-type branched-subunit amino acid transport system substrate-binding protein
MIKRRWLWVLPLAALLATVGVASAQAGEPAVHAAQASPSMFASNSVFCTPSKALPNRNISNPGVTKDAITITDMSIDSAGLKRLGVDQPEYSSFFTVFFNEINKCGGINGRKINAKKAIYNPTAPDLTGHLQALCIKATEDQKAFLVVGVGPPQGTSLQRCISISHKTMFNGPVNMSADDFNDAKGRLFSIYPAGDKTAAAVISDMIAQGQFKGKTVGVIGSATSPTAPTEQKEQYVDYLKAKGIDTDAFEILPCTGNVCVQGIGQAVRRMKDKGVNLIIMTANVSVTTVGSLMKELSTQNLKAPVYGPHTGALHADSVQQTLIRTAGTDGARYTNNLGWYAFNHVEVQGAWRTGQAKAAPFANMCHATLAKALNQPAYVFGEKDINTARWTGVVNVCIQVHELARTIESLGANVTTERMAAAIKVQKEIDQTYVTKGLPEFNSTKWYTAGNITPKKGTWVKFAFPCPLPTVQAANACFLPVDRPAVVRTIKY